MILFPQRVAVWQTTVTRCDLVHLPPLLRCDAHGDRTFVLLPHVAPCVRRTTFFFLRKRAYCVHTVVPRQKNGPGLHSAPVLLLQYLTNPTCSWADLSEGRIRLRSRQLHRGLDRVSRSFSRAYAAPDFQQVNRIVKNSGTAAASVRLVEPARGSRASMSLPLLERCDLTANVSGFQPSFTGSPRQEIVPRALCVTGSWRTTVPV